MRGLFQFGDRLMENFVHQRTRDLVDGCLLFGSEIFQKLSITFDFVAPKLFERIPELDNGGDNLPRLYLAAEHLNSRGQ